MSMGNVVIKKYVLSVIEQFQRACPVPSWVISWLFSLSFDLQVRSIAAQHIGPMAFTHFPISRVWF